MGKKNFSGLDGMRRLFARLLGGHVLTAKVVSKELGVQEAAARRHLHKLAGLPGAIKETRGGSLTVKLPTLVPEQPPHAFDVIAGCLLSAFGGAFRETKFKEHADALRARLLSKSRQYCESQFVDRKFWFVSRGGERALPDRNDDLAEIVEALLESRWIRFQYRNGRGVKETKRVRPLTLALVDQQFYVLATYADSDTVRPFRFARMGKVSVGGRFVYPGGYNPTELLRDSFGIFVDSTIPVSRVRVRIDGVLREHAASHRWHPSQEFVGDDTFELRVRTCPEMRRWLLWLGADGEVIEPAELRDDVRNHLAAALKRYESRPGVQRAPRPGLIEEGRPVARRR